MCELMMCHCRHHETKIKMDFLDIFDGVFTAGEEITLDAEARKIETGIE